MWCSKNTQESVCLFWLTCCGFELGVSTALVGVQTRTLIITVPGLACTNTPMASRKCSGDVKCCLPSGIIMMHLLLRLIHYHKQRLHKQNWLRNLSKTCKLIWSQDAKNPSNWLISQTNHLKLHFTWAVHLQISQKPVEKQHTWQEQRQVTSSESCQWSLMWWMIFETWASPWTQQSSWQIPLSESASHTHSTHSIC